MKKHILNGVVALLFLLIPTFAFAQKQWIDLTEYYIVNPSFDGNDRVTGWQGTPFGAANPWENAEHYQRTYDSYQVITGLVPGKYRLSLNAFYRMGSSSNDYRLYNGFSYSQYQYAQLYATTSGQDYYVGIKPASSGASSEDYSMGGATMVGSYGNYKYIPNNMYAAYMWFANGHYQNSLEFNVDQSGMATIGIRKSQTLSEDWTCLDDWKLEYYGTMVKVTSISFSDKNVNLQLGDTYCAIPDILPSNATIQKVTWESSNTHVATVSSDGTVFANNGGTAVITARAVDGSNCSASYTVRIDANVEGMEKLVINEIQSKNVDQFLDPSWNYGGWVELYNPTDKDISIGHCFVSDDPENLTKYQLATDQGKVPAHGYFNLWFDHHDRYHQSYKQIPFKLDCDGGAFYLSDPNGQLIASQEYPMGMGHCSYARTTDGGDTWGWTPNPTPQTSNATTKYMTSQLSAPVCDTDGRMFTSSFSIKVNIPSGTTLRYTTDGTTPVETSAVSSNGVFTISNTSVYRFRLFKTGMIPSPVTTRSYIYKDKAYTLPIVSIVTDPRNMTSADYGIDVAGIGNGRSGNGTREAVNYNMDWDRPASFEYIDMDSQMNQDGYFQQEADISISGGWSRKQNPRSLKVKATKTYDLNSLDYTFFDHKPYNKNKVLLLRNGGNDDHARGRIKDAAIHEILRTSGIDLDMQDVSPSHVFVNGKYRGMMNLRQPSNKHLAYTLYGIDTDEIDAFEMSVDSGYVQTAGTKDAFMQWYNLSADAGDDAVFEQIASMVDIDEYINYMATQFNLVNWDWPHNNLKGYRERKEGAKFRMVFFDVDNVFEQNLGNPFQTFENRRYYTFYPIFEWNDMTLTLEVEHVTIFLNMLQNEKFRKQFIDSYCLINGSVFEPTRCSEIIDSLAAIIAPAMDLEGYSWYTINQASTLKGNFSASRQNNAISYLRNYWRMGLDGATSQKVTLSSNIPEGRILVNDLFVPTGKFEGTLFHPITLKTSAPAGYRFAGWRTTGNNGASVYVFPYGSQWSYYDQGSQDGTGWMNPDYDDAGWQTGDGSFGYNLRNGYVETTTLDYGGDANNKRLTYYFRKHFTLNEIPTEGTQYKLTMGFDDGYKLFVNGQLLRCCRVSENATYTDGASEHGGDPFDTHEISIPYDMLKKGDNVIAVELHNEKPTSSDVYLDAMMTYVPGGSGYIVSTDEEYTLPEESSNVSLTAVYEPEEDKDVLLESGAVPVKVNEVSAGNDVNVDDYFKKDDWIELYNATDKDVDIAGMYISDKAKTPLKFQIPGDIEGLQTVIPAHGYLVLWASKREIIGSQIHTNFKLDNDADKPGCVILTAQDLSWSDTLNYVKHDGKESVGRYPDGGRDVYRMQRPTIGMSNMLTSTAEFLYEYIYTGVNHEDAVERVHSDAEATVEQYYNINGMSMGTNRNALRPGIYIVKYRTADGRTHSAKQVVK